MWTILSEASQSQNRKTYVPVCYKKKHYKMLEVVIMWTILSEASQSQTEKPMFICVLKNKSLENVISYYYVRE